MFVSYLWDLCKRQIEHHYWWKGKWSCILIKEYETGQHTACCGWVKIFKNPSLIPENGWKLSRKKNSQRFLCCWEELESGCSIKAKSYTNQFSHSEPGGQRRRFLVCKQKRRMFLFCWPHILFNQSAMKLRVQWITFCLS